LASASASASPAASGCAASSAESLDRKVRTLARLRREGVPVDDAVPCIEDSKQAKLRAKYAVVDRAIALMAVAGKGEGAPKEMLDGFVKEFDVAPKLSPMEKKFFAAASPTKDDREKLTWRYEALRPLLWALGFLAELPAPKTEKEAPKLGDVFFARGAARFRAEAQLRSAREILDEVDAIVRYHAATKAAREQGKPIPASLDNDVIIERHHALKWLIGYGADNWDSVSTD